MATKRSGQHVTWIRQAFLAGVASLAVLGCQQPVPPAPSPTSTSSATVVATSPSPAPQVASPAPLSSPSPAPSPVAAAKPSQQVWTVISWQATRPYGKEMFTFSGIVNSDGSGGMREPAGNMGFPPNREKAETVMALAERLAPYTAISSGPTGCRIECHGRGQAAATEEDKKSVAALVGC
jgi:hypothetical protein